MPNGSLDKHIFSNNGKAQSFSWEKLHEIALGTARGIEYLHRDMCILHFDIKPHNVLLDQGFKPKVTDFGLAKFFPKEKDFSSVSTARGTIGYISPELMSRDVGGVSSKSDVYSFGMLLLEMAGGRKNVDSKAKSSSRFYFPSWVYDHLTEGDGALELGNIYEIDVETARKLCIVGLWCIQMKPSDRPSMTEVVKMLEGSLEALKMPPRPFLCSPSPTGSSTKEPQLDASTSGQASESMEKSLLKGYDSSSILS
jgi:serine/threonine protein kinase